MSSPSADACPVLSDVSGLEPMWRYEAEPLSIYCYWRYAKNFVRACAAPSFREIKAVSARRRWLVYFIFSPDGRMRPFHRDTLRRLQAHAAGLLVVFAAPEPAQIPDEVIRVSDACFWKDLRGYDFSAYAIALRMIADCSPGADVLVMNDSVFGPLSDLTPFLDGAPWDLTGFTASEGSGQRHIQSYAFILRNVTPGRLHNLRWIFSPRFAFNTAFGAISCQELWMARAAARTMSVGSFWFGSSAHCDDPSLACAVKLVNAGHPFLKRSLVGKHRRFQNEGDVDRLIARLGYDDERK